MQETTKMTRYCPECGHVGDVSATHINCCPDGSAAFNVPEKYAQELRNGFKALIAAPQCLHQIQEPSAAEQAAWHAGLDEGRAQATGSVSNATSQAAPAAVAVPVKLPTGDEIRAIARSVSTSSSDSPSSSEYVMAGYRAALAATMAASNELGSPHEYAKANEFMSTPFGLIPRDVSKAGEIRTSDLAGIYAAPKHIETSDSAMQVVLPELDVAIKEIMELVDALQCEAESCIISHGSLKKVDEIRTAIESKLRALLATATGLPAQAGMNRYCSAGMCVSSDTQHDPKCTAAPQALDDSALLDAMERQRIAVVPEYEGPWDAEIYNDEGQPNHRGSGSTPREAIRAAIAAAKGE